MKSRKLNVFKGCFHPKSVIAFLFAATLALICPMMLCAENPVNDIFDENYNLISRFSAALDEDIISYSTMDDTIDKSISQKVASVINDYQGRLRILQSHTEVGSRSLEMEINLAYSKAKAAGKLAWIYYYNITEITDKGSCNTLLALYEGYKSEIDRGTNFAVVDADSNRINCDINRDVYREKIKNLALSGDSGYCEAIISDTLGSLVNIHDPSLLATELAAVYNTARQELELQRGRDDLMAQLQTVFAIVKPGETFVGSNIAGTLNYKIKDAKSAAEMNVGMKETLHELLSASADEHYTYTFINRLRSDISDVATKASKSQKIGQFSPLFDDYEQNRKKAYAKDRIYELIFKDSDKSDEELKNIEALFNGVGGRIDRCQEQSEMEIELIRAQYRKSLWVAYDSAMTNLLIIKGSYDFSAFEARIISAYTNVSGEIDGVSSDHEQQLEAAISKATPQFLLILDEAKAERFLQDNSDIIKKPKDELSEADEPALKVAISDYIYLDASVQEMLSSQAESIAEKYKSVLNKKIRNLYQDDAFYQELCEKIYQEINSIQTQKIDDFYNSTIIAFKKAQTVQAIILYYRDITSSSEYASFSSEEKEEMTAACRKLADDLAAATSSSIDLTLTQLAEEAKLALDRTSQYARVRISAKNSSNTSIQELLAKVKEDILASTSKNEMIALADDAIFKIYRYLTVDQINLLTDNASAEIQAMEFLSESEKTSFIESLENLRSSLGSEAGVAKNITILTFVWESFSENLEQLSGNANEIDTERARNHYSSLADKNLEALKIEIRGMVHLSDERISEIVSSMDAICSEFKDKLSEYKSSKGINEAYETVLSELEKIKLSSATENLNNYKSAITAELDGLRELKDNYSEAGYNKIIAVIEAAKAKLNDCVSIAECSAVLTDAKNEIAGIDDLLDDARNAALSRLDELMSEYKQEPLLYSADNINRISEIYKSASEKIKAFEAIADIPALNEELEKSIKLMAEIPKDRTFSSKHAIALTDKNAKYPENYDFSEGYWATVSAPGAIASNALLEVFPSSISRDIQSLIRNAARKNTLKIFGAPDESQLKALKKCTISLAVDVRLSAVLSDVTSYELQLLLPNDMSNERVLGIAFTDEEGNVEFYNAQQNGSLLSASLPRLSKCYIITESTTDLTALIIFLIILIVFELIALCFFIRLRRKRKRKEIYMLPYCFSFSINPFMVGSALRIVPENGVGLTLLLSVLALTLGCGIAILARAEFNTLKKQSLNIQKRPPFPQSEQKRLSKREILLLKEKTYLLESKKKQPSYCTVGAKSDTEAQNAFIYKEDIPEKDKYEAYGEPVLRKTEINLDVIARKFDAGEIVTPEAMKRKGLIPQRTDYVKILARGKLTKPLIVEAHDFSRTAEEMLNAIGGEAIRIK